MRATLAKLLLGEEVLVAALVKLLNARKAIAKANERYASHREEIERIQAKMAGQKQIVKDSMVDFNNAKEELIAVFQPPAGVQ